MNFEKKLLTLLKKENGMLFTSQVEEASIPREYLSTLVNKGQIIRTARGAYVAANSFDDEMYRLQARYCKGIFSHGTALYLHDISDRNPLKYSMTFPSHYHASSLKVEGIKAFYVNKDILDLGKIEMDTQFGRKVMVYDLERTICDILRNRSKMDIYLVREACKGYVSRSDKKLNTLMKYAVAFRIENIVRQNVEVLL